MPLQTFKNLSEERKREILHAAYEEFATNTYQIASVTNIVKKLGLAKGSFYRYFENKFDLYKYLIDYAYDMRMEQLEELIENKSYSFFEIVRENFRNKILFDLKYPLESIFLYSVLAESNPEVRPLMANLKREVIQFTKKLIIEFQEKGELTESINPNLAAHFIYQSQLGIYDYLAVFKGFDFRGSIRKGHLFTISEREIMEVVDGIIEIIKSGLKAN